MKIEIPSDLSALSLDDLATLATQARAEFDAIAALDTPTEAQIAEAETLASFIERADAKKTELSARRDALRTRFTAQRPEDPVNPGQEPGSGRPEEQPATAPSTISDEERNKHTTSEEEAAEQARRNANIEEQERQREQAGESGSGNKQSEETVEKGGKQQASVRKVAAASSKPNAPVALHNPITITAAADVPGFATSAALNMEQVGEALVNRMKGFAPPAGDGSTENLHHYGVAQFRLDFPEDLVIDRHSDDLEVLKRAADESRLPGNSLVAAGGWCAPSETVYDLVETEVADGLLTVPEVAVRRGGIRYTMGPDFSAIYDNTGFYMTEAQSIAGFTKPCYEVPCPPFVEKRLDAIGLCIKAPILQNAAYPELTQRWLRGAMVAHQRKVNFRTIDAISTAIGATRVMTDYGTTTGSTLSALEFIGDQMRQQYAMGLNQSLEVVVPFWVKGAVRSDLSLRTGIGLDVVTDAVINAHFAARKVNVQFVMDYQPLATDAATTGYPATFDVLVYRAGSFVRGTSDVISMNAVYDSASLAQNIYTALFFEEGILVAQMQPGSTKITLATANTGRTGAHDITERGLDTV